MSLELRKVGTQADCDERHNDLHSMDRRRKDWQMTFNIDQCNCLHIGHGNNQTSYQLGGQEVPTATQEKVLALLSRKTLKSMSSMLKWPTLQIKCLAHIEYCIQLGGPITRRKLIN